MSFQVDSRIPNLCCLDSRYRKKLEPIFNIFSDDALTQEKINIEVKYLKLLSNLVDELKPFKEIISRFFIIAIDFDELDKLESETDHDIKAIEYYVKKKLDSYLISENVSEENRILIGNFVHFAITSEDINSPANVHSIKNGVGCLIEQFEEIIMKVESIDQPDTLMCGLTHGQPAIYTTIHNFFKTYTSNIKRIIKKLKNEDLYECKFSGATGGMNAHYLAYPTIDWLTELTRFIKEEFSLNRELCPTQISKNVVLMEVFSLLKILCLHMAELCRNVWMYISINYFVQKIDDKTTGSSTMPHKLNPIKFENAEGNYVWAGGLVDNFHNLLNSRLQRDLSGSTIVRRFPELFGTIYLASDSLLKGLDTISINQQTILRDVNNNYQILTEPIQTLLRKWGYVCPYETLKNLSKGKILNKETLIDIIQQLALNECQTNELLSLSPCDYYPVKF